MSESATIRSVITPNDKLLRSVFQTPKPYFIDIYQREYRWTKTQVDTLLRDIALRFEQHELVKIIPKEIQQDVQANFEPYFLNTYLTHTSTDAVALVDGQQRLTTILLMLIKLYKVVEAIEGDSSYTEKTFSSDVLRKLIFETDDFGEAARFKIYNPNREAAFRELIGEQALTTTDETQQRIRANYKTISDYYDRFFQHPGHTNRIDLRKLTYYITYLLDRVSIVEIKIEKQKNVAMIFEVVNDRGLGLKPYEILKGKLLGNLPASEKEIANATWTRLQNDYFRLSLSESSEITLDDFFRIFFRARFANSENEYQSFEGDYHYQMYRNPRVREYFRDFNDPELLFHRIQNDIRYFADEYRRLRASYDYEFLVYNRLLEQNQQYLLVLASLNCDDPQRDNKINKVTQKFDQLHSISRLLDLYDSNAFQRRLYPLVKEIRVASLEDISLAFDEALLRYFDEQNALPGDVTRTLDDIFTFENFVLARNRWTNFSKYVLMRIDRYLAQLLDKPSYASAGLKELESRFNKNNRRRYGMHLEHIYTNNDVNLALFKREDGGEDAATFHQVRNLLGMVLLLKDMQNISSGNELYKDKLETYKQSNFIWNELLAGHLHQVDLRNIPTELNDAEVVVPLDCGAFPRDKVGKRQQVMFNMIRTIWHNSVH